MKDCPPGKEFIFKMPDGRVVGRAKNVAELVHLIKTAPIEAVLFHAKGDHFSPWLSMLGETKKVSQLKKAQITEKTVRIELLRALKE
ncbi:MAG: hypothetical protein N3G80_00905 [Candidatus Micrarchaeota archaeon]|nr:hypothetical protein [Candidatus Micrarchaeota archaeon]